MENRILPSKAPIFVLLALLYLAMTNFQSVLAAATAVIILTTSGLSLALSIGGILRRQRLLRRLGVFP